MTYTVIWQAVQLDRLAELYVASDLATQQRMAEGVEAFSARLADDPLQVGESRSDGFRVAFPPLLTVSFHVDQVRRRVRITRVTRYGS